MEWNAHAEKKCDEAFSFIDEDGSGKLSVKELRLAANLMGMNPTAKDIEQVLQAADTNNDGELDPDEFRTLMKLILEEINAMNPDLLIKEALDNLDTNGDGLIDKMEFRTYLQTHGDEPLKDDEINSLFDDLDRDKSGFLDRKEIEAMMRQPLEQEQQEHK